MGRGITVSLDADWANATVALIAGPECQAGETLITVHEINEPFESFTTPFTVLPPNETPEGVTTLPGKPDRGCRVERRGDDRRGGVPRQVEDKIRFGSEEFQRRCRGIEGEEELYPTACCVVTENGTPVPGSEVNGLELGRTTGTRFVLASRPLLVLPGNVAYRSRLESKPFARTSHTART